MVGLMEKQAVIRVKENFPQHTKRVLVADDSEVIRQRLKSLISDIEVVELVGEAEDTQSAIQLWQSTKPDIVILDLRMPGGGGTKVLREIKIQSPETVVIILTNYPYMAYHKKCTELGADYFFDKALEFDKVKDILIGGEESGLK
ncbi:MAG: response regulator [Chloroflexi bacterium]|nr:MAG: response regulator [Chloroflexota bacterium]